MQVEAARGLEYSMELHQARGHHHQVGHHLVSPHELAQRTNHLSYVRGRFRHELVIGALGILRPMPGILECGDLRLAILARFILEEHVVIA